MGRNSKLGRGRGPRLAAGLAVAAVCLVLALPLGRQAAGQWHLSRGRHLLDRNLYADALAAFNRAALWQPEEAAVYQAEGETCFRAALILAGNNSVEEPLLRKAESAFRKARRYNPLEPETLYGLAMTRARLEELDPEPPAEPESLDLLARAVASRPNLARYRLAYCRLLFRYGRQRQLLVQARGLGMLAPRSLGTLNREEFWSGDVRDAYAAGLEEAVAAGIQPVAAHRSLAALKADAGEYGPASEHQRRAMELAPFQTGAGDYYRLGRLLLRAGRPGQAGTAFLRGLESSDDREGDLERLYSFYRREAGVAALAAFYTEAGERFRLSSRLDILLARSLMDGGELAGAREILEELGRREPGPEPHYWLARLAEKTGDRDAMELAIQKAVSRDPDNAGYRYHFARALVKNRKPAAAEKQADRAIALEPDPSAWYYHLRALTRWQQEKYRPAIEDWQRAVELLPDRAGFYARIGAAYRRLDAPELAAGWYARALSLEPENESYRREAGAHD